MHINEERKKTTLRNNLKCNCIIEMTTEEKQDYHTINLLT